MRRNRPGWGRHPDEEFFHIVPESHGGPHRKRAIFRLWPRDPKGMPIIPTDKPRGMLSPDGYPWGATLYDIYSVRRLPNIPNMVSFMTGSALREVMEAMGEVDVAAPEIEWARSEGKPRVEGAADTEELINCIDMRARLFSVEKDKEDGGDEDQDEEAEQASEYQREKDNGQDPTCVPPAPTIPVTSPFHRSHYPEPWPLTPFEHPFSVVLQERIPLYLLPQTLYVHDPFNLLPASERRFQNTSWTSRPDIVRTYNLYTSETVRSQVEKARDKAKELEELKARTLIILRYQRTKEQIKKHQPVIEVPLPPYPRRLTEVEESHLYLSPVAKVGEGHHSIVYKGEWELPRALFMKKRICSVCFKESADNEVQRLKDTGRWDKMMKAASWGPNGFTGRQPTEADLDAVNDPTNLARDGEIIEREITCIVPPNAPPSKIVEMVDDSTIWADLMKRREANSVHLRFVEPDSDEEDGEDSYVAHIRIDPPFSYEHQEKICTHRPHLRQGPTPRTATFTVVAKLSLENDQHLAREARNYQNFPERFFEHYNGYTIIKQLHAIVPVNAVVPQYYGYYKPKVDTDRNPEEPAYLSPILLLEHCGAPVEPDELTKEEQEECASLILRFQKAGWLHESIAPRNFLVQLGKPTEFPLVRGCKPERSFRLIDFGRSRKYTMAASKFAEEKETLLMFSQLGDQMAYTLAMGRREM